MMNVYSMVFLLALLNAGVAQAQTQEKGSLVEQNDCSNISVDYRNNPNLTQQEKIELMDKALFHSLNKYEGCQSIRANAAGGGAGGGTGGGASKGGSGASTASSEMSGTQKAAAQESSSDNLSNKTVTDSAREGSNKPAQNVHLKGSGKIPDDIPPVDNDSILEAQIRQAAMDETNPAIKAKLWDEYRKYKGLPAQQGVTQ